MAEKLYKCHCRVPGHGILCEVAQDKKKGKRELSKFRRRLCKKECSLLTKRALDGATGWRKMDDGSMGDFDWSNITEELPRK